MSDGEDDDDQPPQGERQRQRSRSCERVFPHVPVPQDTHIQSVVTPESDDEISDEDFTIVDSSSPSAEQRNHSRRSERSRSRERVYPRSSSHDSQQQQPVVPHPPGKQQNQATQSEDENSATVVDPQNRVTNHSRSPRNQGDTRRQGPQTPKAKKNTAEKQPSTPQKAKKYKLMDSDEDDEEPQNEPGTSSNSQTTVPITSSSKTSSQLARTSCQC